MQIVMLVAAITCNASKIPIKLKIIKTNQKNTFFMQESMENNPEIPKMVRILMISPKATKFDRIPTTSLVRKPFLPRLTRTRKIRIRKTKIRKIRIRENRSQASFTNTVDQGVFCRIGNSIRNTPIPKLLSVLQSSFMLRENPTLKYF